MQPVWTLRSEHQAQFECEVIPAVHLRQSSLFGLCFCKQNSKNGTNFVDEVFVVFVR